jgi:hypothetical protein
MDQARNSTIPKQILRVENSWATLCVANADAGNRNRREKYRCKSSSCHLDADVVPPESEIK